MGGSASRTAGGILGNITGSEGETRGVSADVGRTETAIDLTLGIDYGRNIVETVEEVRRRVSESVGRMTGLRITELNATVKDIVFPDGGPGAGSAAGTRPEAGERPRQEDRAQTRTAEEPAGEKTAEIRPGGAAQRTPRGRGEEPGRRGGERRGGESGETMGEWRTARGRRDPRAE